MSSTINESNNAVEIDSTMTDGRCVPFDWMAVDVAEIFAGSKSIKYQNFTISSAHHTRQISVISLSKIVNMS